MIKKILKIDSKNTKGFALIFTILIVSVISVVSSGLINSSFKQKILSSLAKDSQVAFYMADTASDCALYADLVVVQNNPNQFKTEGDTWTCGGYDLTIHPIDADGSYNLSLPELSDSLEPCFEITVDKNLGADTTKITARGYNICDKTNLRVVEREIEVNYSY